MLDQRDISKFTRPLLISLASKTALFLLVLVFLAAKDMTGFSSPNTPTSHSDPYTNLKSSHYQVHILMAQFMMVLIALSASALSLTLFATFLIALRKQQKNKIGQKIRISQETLRVHFLLSFIESICTITILSRSIQKVSYLNLSSSYLKGDFITFLSFSILVLLILALNIFVLFKLLVHIKIKQKTLKQFSFYSDQITLQQNLLFNKSGYIKELFKLEDYSSKSSSLKDELIKAFPSGFRRNSKDISPLRQIVYKLRGGNDTTSKVVKQSSDDGQMKLGQDNSQMIKNQLQKYSDQDRSNQLNYLNVNRLMTNQSPNNENYQNIEMALNVIDLHIKNNVFQDLKKLSEQEGELQNQIQKHNDRIINSKKNLMKLNIASNQKKNSLELNLEEQLRQRFNLTPNAEARRRHATNQNHQNIDEQGNYYFVNVDRIKKKSKLLDLQKLKDQSSNVDFNTLYARGQWYPKQKRASKKHQRYIAEYLQKKQKIRKEEALIQEKYSSQSESLEESELSSNASHSQSLSQVEQVPIDVEGPTNVQQDTVRLLKKKRQRNNVPELYLHLNVKKKRRELNKLKLYNEDDSFYDSSSENEDKLNDDVEIIREKQKGIMASNLNEQKISSREHKLAKAKKEEKIELANKHIQTQQARMLLFIRKKYIQPLNNNYRLHTTDHFRQLTSGNEEQPQTPIEL